MTDIYDKSRAHNHAAQMAANVRAYKRDAEARSLAKAKDDRQTGWDEMQERWGADLVECLRRVGESDPAIVAAAVRGLNLGRAACPDCAIVLDELSQSVLEGRLAVDEERHAVVLRLQARALAIRTLGKKYRWAADILEDEARAIKEGKHRG